MKRIVLLITMIAAGSLLFAEGAQERPTPFGDVETTTLSGTIDISQFPPVLNTGDEEYLVMVPRRAADEISIEDGQELVLEGYVHEGRGRWNADEEMVIAVTKATIDGEVYEIELPRDGERFAGGPGCCGPQQGTRGRMPMGDSRNWGGGQPRNTWR